MLGGSAWPEVGRHIVFVFTIHYNSIPLVCLYNIKFTLIPLLCCVVDIMCCLSGRFISHINCNPMTWARSVNVWGQSREVSIVRTSPSTSPGLQPRKWWDASLLVGYIWRQISDGTLSVIVGWHWTVECACAISWNRIYVVQHDWNIDEHIWALIL